MSGGDSREQNDKTESDQMPTSQVRDAIQGWRQNGQSDQNAAHLGQRPNLPDRSVQNDDRRSDQGSQVRDAIQRWRHGEQRSEQPNRSRDAGESEEARGAQPRHDPLHRLEQNKVGRDHRSENMGRQRERTERLGDASGSNRREVSRDQRRTGERADSQPPRVDRSQDHDNEVGRSRNNKADRELGSAENRDMDRRQQPEDSADQRIRDQVRGHVVDYLLDEVPGLTHYALDAAIAATGGDHMHQFDRIANKALHGDYGTTMQGATAVGVAGAELYLELKDNPPGESALNALPADSLFGKLRQLGENTGSRLYEAVHGDVRRTNRRGLGSGHNE